MAYRPKVEQVEIQLFKYNVQDQEIILCDSASWKGNIPFEYFIVSRVSHCTIGNDELVPTKKVREN